MERQRSFNTKDKTACRRFAIGFLLIFWGVILCVLEIPISNFDILLNILLNNFGILISNFDVLPDFIGALLLLFGTLYFVTQQHLFSRTLKLLAFIMPLFAFILFVGSIIELIAFDSGATIWTTFIDGSGGIFYLCLAAMGWKIADIYIPKMKRRWVALLILSSILIFIALSSVSIFIWFAFSITLQVVDIQTLQVNLSSFILPGLSVFAVFLAILVTSFFIYLLDTISLTRKALLKIVEKTT